MKREVIIRWALTLAVVGAGGFWYGRSRAQSAPPTTPVLYSGYLEDSGVPVNGTRYIGIDLWKSTDTTDITNCVCEQYPEPTTVSGGWFTVQLGATCLDAVHRYPALFLEFVVDSTKFPLKPIGAVPYAVRAFEHESGARLKKIYVTASDGSKEVVQWRWWDSQRNEECTFQEANTPARAKLCLPATGVGVSGGGPCVTPEDMHADAACSVAATGGGVSDVTPKYISTSAASSGLATPGQPYQIYCTSYGAGPCNPTNHYYYFPDTLLPASDFVSWQEQHD